MSRNTKSKHVSLLLGSGTGPSSILAQNTRERRTAVANGCGSARGPEREALPRCTDGLWHSEGCNARAVAWAARPLAVGSPPCSSRPRNLRTPGLWSRRTRWLFSCRAGNQSPFAVGIGIVARSSAGLMGLRTSRAFAHTRKNETASQPQFSGGSKNCASRNPCAVI